jgi:hypothetical protein
VVEVAFIACWLLLRLAGVGFGPYVLWIAAAAVLILLSPASGLVVLVAAAPWGGERAISAEHILGLKNLLPLELLPLVLAVSVGVRLLVDRRSLPRTRTFGVALALLAVSLVLGVGMMYVSFHSVTGWESAQYWLSGMGGALIVFLAAVWIGRSGERRPLWVAVAASSAAGLLSLLDYLWPSVFANLPLQRLLMSNDFGTRLAGAIASPNAMVSLLVTPAAVLLAAVILAPGRWRRAVVATVLPFLLAAMWFTYSRSALIGIFVIVVIVLWRWRRALGAGLLVAGLVGGLALAPAYLQARGGVLGGSATVEPGTTLIASDVQRVTAWKAASAMWLDAPLLGQGFRSYHILGPEYGDQVLGSPHNEWIRLFAEEGIIGGLLGLAFAVAVALQLARTSGWLGAGAFGAFSAWAISATFNNPFLFLQVSAIAMTVAGIMVGLGREGLGAPQPQAEEP